MGPPTSIPPTSVLATRHGARLEWLATGTGEPTTVFAHGLAGDITGTRPLGSAVAGRRVFFHFRGHGRSTAPSAPWDYADLARDLVAVADHCGARRAVGASLGAAALCRLLVGDPDRFERVVFVLPAVLDRTRPSPTDHRLTRLVDAVAAGEAATVRRVLAEELPAAVRDTPAGTAYLTERVARLVATGLAVELAGLTAAVPVADPAGLAAVTAPALVIATAGDELHPVPVAERLAAALPAARLHVYDTPGVLWSHRADLRRRISEFLNARPEIPVDP